jgi:hypothetical protein
MAYKTEVMKRKGCYGSPPEQGPAELREGQRGFTDD